MYESSMSGMRVRRNRNKVDLLLPQGQFRILLMHGPADRRKRCEWQHLSKLQDEWLVPKPQMTGRRRLFAFAIVSAAAALQLRGAVLPIHIHRHGAVAGGRGTITAQSVADSSVTLSFPLPAPSISLPRGDW